MALFNKDVKHTPLHVTATGTITARSTGGVNAIALVNSSKQPMEIRQIKWTFPEFNGAGIACKFDLGKIALTNGYIPIYNFGKKEGFGEYLYAPFVFGAASVYGITTPFLNQYRWNLSRPLYIPAGAALVPSFEHRGQSTASIPMRIDYAGSLLPAGYRPKKLALPYVGVYSSKVMLADAADTDSSSETDLLNPFDTPLKLERFTGRVNLFYNSGAIGAFGGGYTSLDINLAETMISESLTVRMGASTGERLVRDATVFGQVFSAVTRSWETKDAEMAPNSYYLVDLFKAARTDFGTGLYSLQATVGVVGWREIAGGLEIT